MDIAVFQQSQYLDKPIAARARKGERFRHGVAGAFGIAQQQPAVGNVQQGIRQFAPVAILTMQSRSQQGFFGSFLQAPRVVEQPTERKPRLGFIVAVPQLAVYL